MAESTSKMNVSAIQAEIDKAQRSVSREEYFLETLLEIVYYLQNMVEEEKKDLSDDETKKKDDVTSVENSTALEISSSARKNSSSLIATESFLKKLMMDGCMTLFKDKINISEVIKQAKLANADQPTLTGTVELATDKDGKNDESSDVEVQVDGCQLTAFEQTCSGALSSEGTATFRDEANSAQVLTTGSPPGCEVPLSGCVGIQSVMPSEHVLIDGSHDLSSSVKESHADFGIVMNNDKGRKDEAATGEGGVPRLSTSTKDKDSYAEPTDVINNAKEQDDECITGVKGFPYNKVEDYPSFDVVIGTSDTSKDQLAIGNSKMNGKNKVKSSKKTAKVKNKVKIEKKSAKADKNEKHLEDEKVQKSKKLRRRRLFSLFCCCFRKQENDDLNEGTKESGVENITDQLEDNSERRK